jgi:two-component system, cell cycle sensor histidine kinase and response regulator CckA
MTGYTEQELLTMKVTDLLPEHTTLQLFTQVAQEHEAGFREVELLRKDGTAFNALITGSELEIGNDRFVQGFVQDITERKRAEEQISDALGYSQTIFDASPIGIVTFQENGELVSANKAAATILGGTLEQMLTQNFRTLKSMEQSGLQAAAIAALSSNRENEVEVHHVSTFGKDLWLSARFVPFSHQNQTQLLFLMTDVTDRKRAEEALRQGQKLESIGTLAGGIAHDFNNVLGGIMGYGEMSLKYAEKDSKLEKNLLKILKATDRAKHLIEQILTFSRKTDSKMTITAVRPIIREVLDLLRASIPSSVIIDSNLDKNTKPILADPTKIHEAILNLATNAVHAMNRKGTLTIKLYAKSLDQKLYGQVGEIAPGEYTAIEVADTGCGMDPTTLVKAFEPFFTTKPVGEGTGMGLSVVLGVVQSIGGDIQIQSEVGKGTTFTLYLPVVEESPTEASDAESLAQLTGTERILFVDDEQMLIEMGEDMLTSLGYKVTCISNSLEALQFVREKGNDIDVLITDQTMPGMTGIELAKEVMKIRNGLPIILCTGFSSELNPERAMAIGVDHVVMKPFRINEIGRAIRAVMEKGR